MSRLTRNLVARRDAARSMRALQRAIDAAPSQGARDDLVAAWQRAGERN